MINSAYLNGSARVDLIAELERRYSGFQGSPVGSRLRLARKRYLWLFVTDGSRLLKRIIDIAVGTAALISLSPLFLLVAIAIKRTSAGPVMFWQTRVGQWGREFRFPKFRSMVTDAEAMKDKLAARNDHAEGVTFKMKNDPRVTSIGRIIRKLSIDELPQLACVVAGEMSLVGPRPALPKEVAKYTLADRRRLDVKPGLTCIWQVSGRGEIPFHKQVQLDVKYIESQSFWVDVRLLALTVPAVLFGRGAY